MAAHKATVRLHFTHGVGPKDSVGVVIGGDALVMESSLRNPAAGTILGRPFIYVSFDLERDPFRNAPSICTAMPVIVVSSVERDGIGAIGSGRQLCLMRKTIALVDPACGALQGTFP